MRDATYCPMIHGGLQIRALPDQVIYNQCCLSSASMMPVDFNFWNSSALTALRSQNNQGHWHKGCDQCASLERANQESLRTGMIKKFGVQKELSGPLRIDLMFDKSCNLACRTCGPSCSTFWQQHLKENKLSAQTVESFKSSADQIISTLNTLDLSNLGMVVFCGGETLMGPNYWKVTEYLATTVPEQITLSFQTNGTQSIPEKYLDLISKFHLVKLNISLDGIGKRFEYLRWPASWEQVTENIFKLKETAPVNVMFLIEETISIFNLYYQDELESWTKNNFSSNRLGDIINHTRHLAHGNYSLSNLTDEYVNQLSNSHLKNFVDVEFSENPDSVHRMIKEIKQFDLLRKENFQTTFPEVAEFYSRYF